MAIRFSRFNDSINCCNKSRYAPGRESLSEEGFKSPMPSTKMR